MIVLFDGICNLCNASVNFIIDRDPGSRFKFATLQSDFARKKLSDLRVDFKGTPESILLIDDRDPSKTRVFTESSAALKIATHLRGGWPLLGGFLVVPKPLRNGVYRWIARNRYRWFGKSDQCRLPGPGDTDRFLS